MAERLARVGFIGCGRFATEAIYPSLRHAALDLPAVCSRTADKAERTARQAMRLCRALFDSRGRPVQLKGIV